MISFSYNNKLDCKAFTTLRIHNPNKYRVGDTHDIQLKSVSKGNAMIMNITPITLDQINEYIAHIDTGYDSFKCKEIILKMYPK